MLGPAVRALEPVDALDDASKKPSDETLERVHRQHKLYGLTVSRCARHVPPFASWLDAEDLPDDVVKVTVDLAATAQPRERRASSFTVVAGE
jgi:hypothetical protein